MPKSKNNELTNMNEIFTNCGNLTSISLENFDTNRVKSMKNISKDIPLYLVLISLVFILLILNHYLIYLLNVKVYLI